MDRYYYHGIETYLPCIDHEIKMMIDILTDGIKTRSEIFKYSSNKLNHVCLYKKNEELDYDTCGILETARTGWIDNCLVFIISPNIDAYKYDGCGIKDEWRCPYTIKPDKIVGVGLPYNCIEELINSERNSKELEKLRELFPKLIEIIKSRNLIMVDSSEENFTDRLDNELNNKKIKKRV